MRIYCADPEEEPNIVGFFVLEREGWKPRLRAKTFDDTVIYRVIYVQDYLVNAEDWIMLEALAKLLDINRTDLSKPVEACKLYSCYLDSKYPTYSYH